MQKKFEIFMVACLFICSFFLARAGAAYVCAKNLNTKNLCIVLDAGHGGADPGKVGCNDILEKDVNLSIVHKLKTLFENKGFRVVLTREDDTVLADENSKNVKIEDLRNRVALITETMPVMTISIHQNSFTNPNVKGAQSFFYEKSEKSKKLGLILQNHLNKKINTEKEKVAKPNNSYYMLINSKCPGTIVECGFLSNPSEEESLSKEEYQKKLAEIICTGIKEYFGEK